MGTLFFTMPHYFIYFGLIYFYTYLSLQTHIFTFILCYDYNTPQKHYNYLLTIPDAIWMKQQLTDTFVFNDYWLHDLHDLGEPGLY